jgi:hypothetical protein
MWQVKIGQFTAEQVHRRGMVLWKVSFQEGPCRHSGPLNANFSRIPRSIPGLMGRKKIMTYICHKEAICGEFSRSANCERNDKIKPRRKTMNFKYLFAIFTSQFISSSTIFSKKTKENPFLTSYNCFLSPIFCHHLQFCFLIIDNFYVSLHKFTFYIFCSRLFIIQFFVFICPCQCYKKVFASEISIKTISVNLSLSLSIVSCVELFKFIIIILVRVIFFSLDPTLFLFKVIFIVFFVYKLNLFRFSKVFLFVYQFFT